MAGIPGISQPYTPVNVPDTIRKEEGQMITVTITEPTEYKDQSFETASWYVKYELQPGTYEVVPWTNLPHYRHFKARAIRIEENFINRLFGSSSKAPQSARIGKEEEVWVDFPATYEKDPTFETYLKYHPTFKVEVAN